MLQGCLQGYYLLDSHTMSNALNMAALGSLWCGAHNLMMIAIFQMKDGKTSFI
jgi:hypothetical protein